MEKNIGIIHLSDIHASSENKNKICKLVSLLKNDLHKLSKENNIEIKFLCITGDLINSGDLSDEQFEIVLSCVIQPLTEHLQIPDDSVFIVAGNHEVKRSKIVEYIEKGLLATLSTEAEIQNFFHSSYDNAIERIDYFQDYTSIFSEDTVQSSPFSQSYIRNVNGFNIGFSCINSSWRSTGIGMAEKGNMIIGKKTIVDSLDSIKSADLKICLMHHPLDWLVDSDNNSIEKCINEFDIVLNGHIHQSLSKIYTSFNGRCLFNTCGKFDNSSDIYNGYSVISVNPFNKECKVFARQYLDYPRNCYDKAISVLPEGFLSAQLGAKNDILILAYNTIQSIKHKFISFANSYFISNLTSNGNISDIDKDFISPIFSEYSEYEKETQFDEKPIDKSNDKNNDKEEITIDYLCEMSNNILLLGKKEIGKTTILHFITKHYINNFNTLKSVPIIIDCLLANYKGKNNIEKECLKFINEYCDDVSSFSQAEINMLISSGNCIIMFDNFETVENKQLRIINEFIKKYPDNRYLFTVKETISARSIRDTYNTPNCDYKEYHICSLSKRQIRSYAKNTLATRLDDYSPSLVDKIMLCFKKTTLPKTPFVLSIVVSLCNNSDFTPINEAVVMEQFIESLLEKVSPLESDTKTYDFRSKENFLMYLVQRMHNNNRYFFEHNEFEKITTDYHEELGFSVLETKFDKLFFDKGILIKTQDIVTFRYTCIIEYYIAKIAKDDQNFLSTILNGNTYLNYENELLYYTGLNRKDYRILESVSNNLKKYINEFEHFIDELNNYDIGIDISQPEEDFSKKITDSRLSESESDRISNSEDYSEKKLPEEIDKEYSYDNMNAFISTLLIFGSCVKNLEFITKADKINAYQLYSDGLCVLLAIIKTNMEKQLDEQKEIIRQSETDLEDQNKKIKEIEKYFSDILRIALPLYIQNIALENIGTNKLKQILEQAINTCSNDDFKLFFSVFTYCDLRIPGLKKELSNYISMKHSKSLLTIIFFKLLYYYRFRYFSPNLDQFLENALADINIKIGKSKNIQKGYTISNIKKLRNPYENNEKND